MLTAERGMLGHGRRPLEGFREENQGYWFLVLEVGGLG